MPKDAFIYPRRDSETRIIQTANSLERLSGIPLDDWKIVRSYNNFVTAIDYLGIPNVVSFDHDLTEECMELYMTNTRYTGFIEYDNLPKRTGWHCAKYLIEKCRELKVDFPKYFVHSANEYGTQNIKRLIEESKND